MTVAHTARKQGKEVLTFLVRSIEARLNGAATPLLLDAWSGVPRSCPHARIVPGHLASPDTTNPARSPQSRNRTLKFAGSDRHQLSESRPGLTGVCANQIIEPLGEFGQQRRGAVPSCGSFAILFALLVVGKADLPGAETLLSTAVNTVLLSTVLHGVTAYPLAQAYGRRKTAS